MDIGTLVYQVGPDIFLNFRKCPKYGLQKAEKQGHCYSKREEAAWPLLFLNNNDADFLHPAFCKPYFGFFFRLTNQPMFSKQE